MIVHPGHRQQGIGRDLAQAAFQAAYAAGRTAVTFSTGSRIPAAGIFAQKLGAHPALPMTTTQLLLADVDQRQVQTWMTRPQKDPFRLRLFVRIPEDALERVAQVMMVMNTAPQGDLSHEETVITPAMIRAWEEAITVAGKSALSW